MSNLGTGTTNRALQERILELELENRNLRAVIGDYDREAQHYDRLEAQLQRWLPRSRPND